GLFTGASETIEVSEPVLSRDHTERMLNAMGVSVQTGETIRLIGRKQDLAAQDMMVPGDISSAAFWLVGAAILPGSQLSVKNVSLNPTRLGLLNVLKQAGVTLYVNETGLSCGEPFGDITVGGGALKGNITITHELVPELIDEIPILTILGMFTHGT